ncbi:GNAT family N-acetyltransferase [Aeromonas sobria]|uniref:GNAT family N-acetyltransferase n=1 Tax=Aeromonas sobria TaxID=646 RepID=UPI003D08E1D2
MQTELVAMSQGQYERYVAQSWRDYAEENVATGRWPQAGALARARAEYEALLPQGLATSSQQLFAIQDGAGQTVGGLWLAIRTAPDGQRSGFVYDITILPGARRQGHGRRAFTLLESLARAQGLVSIGLNVFANNPAALALYRRLGYRVTNLAMSKAL